MADYFCHLCGQRTSMMGHRDCQSLGRYRFRVNQNGWYRHFGGPMLDILRGVRIEIVPRSGSAWATQGYPAEAYRGWEHAGFSGDIMFWKPVGTVLEIARKSPRLSSREKES